MTNRSPLTPVIIQVGHDAPFASTLEAFVRDNNATDDEIIQAAWAVRRGERFTGGGGAAPIWTIAPGETLFEALSAPQARPRGWDVIDTSAA